MQSVLLGYIPFSKYLLCSLCPKPLLDLVQFTSEVSPRWLGCCRCSDWRVRHLEERLRWGLVGGWSTCETWISAVIPASWASTAYAGLRTRGKVLSTELTPASSRYLDKRLTQISRLIVFLLLYFTLYYMLILKYIWQCINK